MQIIAQLARTKHVHIHNRHLLARLNSLRHHCGQRRVERLNRGSQAGFLAWNNLRDNDNGIRHRLEHVVQQQPKSLRRICIWFTRWVAAVEVIRAGVQEHDIGLQCQSAGGDAPDLADRVSREALVVFVGHGAGFLRSDEIDSVPRGLEVRKKALPVSIRAAAVDVAPGDGVAKREDAEGRGLAGEEVGGGERGGEGEDWGAWLVDG
jgi:hypothetical protein